MVYKIYYRNTLDVRAPSIISMHEYEEALFTVESKTRSSLLAAISKIDDPTVKVRQIKVGDAVSDEEGNFFIYTMFFQWAMVEVA